MARHSPLPRRSSNAFGSGARVYLRPLIRSDADRFVAAVRASRSLHRPWVNPPSTRDAFIRRVAQRDGGRRVSMLALRRADDAFVGVLNLSEIVRGPLQQAFLGYYAFAPHAGNGYMREAMRLLLRYAFGPLKLHRVEANIQPANLASLALARGAGFNREGFSPRYLKIGGRWCDHERWAINAEQWKALRAPVRSPH
jgi:[ribosomal protein S5]-alanine N-acetyltransferase